ncbi:uncharacterized protein LOC142986232 isoform X2 [Anticarsia gemmatalis]|uniref:uncharacterized protein LOC142986232 isoform X2 n=1 Tax=Anticarsia gemmatalis TaxID=129554 RepID=UPI003F7628BD
MWPYELNNPPVAPPLNESDEMGRNSQFPATPPISPRDILQPREGADNDPPGQQQSPVDLLVLKSIQTYRTECFQYLKGKMPIRSRHLQVFCEVFALRTPRAMQSTSCSRPPMSQLLWPNRPNRRAQPRSTSRSPSPNLTNEDTASQSSDESSSDEQETRRNVAIYPESLENVSCSPKKLEPSFPRRRLRSIQNMPQASLSAQQVANRVIKYARSVKNTYEEDLCCIDCGLFPTRPVTGLCGHTRCTKCAKEKNTCPCGSNIREPLCVNIVVRDIIESKIAVTSVIRTAKTITPSRPSHPVTSAVNKTLNGRGSSSGPIRTKRKTRPCTVAPFSGPYRQQIPMSARARFAYALELLQSGKHRDAAPQLALAGASAHSELRVARKLLAQVIMILSPNHNPRALTRELNHLVRHLSSMSWVKIADMECVLCCDTYTQPVTTPCGHMFCRTCLEKTLDYKKRCPLCLRDLGDLKLTEVNDTKFVKGALASINALNEPMPMEEDGLVPIFVCTVAYPSVPCPLFIFDPRYWLMIRRVLESGSRRFGMVACDRDKKYADYGTILEVRDCVHLEDGRSILSTIGLSRFRVIERSVRDGCEVARIQPINDTRPEDSMAIDVLKMYETQIMLKAILWLSHLSGKILTDIENAFGCLDRIRLEDDNNEWWDTADGPAWLWWLVAVLPLRTEIKVLILSTESLEKRMMAVSRTLEAVENVTLTTTLPSQYQIRVDVPSVM